MENDENMYRENEKTGVENDKSLCVEKEKKNMENSKNQSKETEVDLSTEKEKSTSVENGNIAPLENEKNSSVPSRDCLEKPSATKESSESTVPSEPPTSGTKDLGNPTLQVEQMGPSSIKDGIDSTNAKDSGSLILPGEGTGPTAVKDGSDSVSSMLISSTNPNDSGQPALPVEVVTSSGNEVNELKWTGEKPDSTMDSGNLASVDVVEKSSNISMVVNEKPPTEEQESNDFKQNGGTKSTIASTEAPGAWL